MNSKAGHFIDGPSTPLDGPNNVLGDAGEAQIVLSATGKLPTIENLLGKLGPLGALSSGVTAGVQTDACFDRHP